MTTQSNAGLHGKYRPRVLDEIIGNETAVNALKAAVSSGKWPSAIGFFGPTSAGKTTLAYALGCSALNARKVADNCHPSFTEMSGTANKTIEDVRSAIAISRQRPQGGPRRFVLIDEAQGLLSNPQATEALYGALERPPASTTWIFTSMDSEKFGTSQRGRALANRLVQFHLDPPSQKFLKAFAKRIIIGEEMTYLADKELVARLTQSCNGEYRTLANLIEAAQLKYISMPEKPELFTADDLDAVLVASSDPDDDRACARYMNAMLTFDIRKALKVLLAVKDHFQFINKMLWVSNNIVMDDVLAGERHPQVWLSPVYKAIKPTIEDVPLHVRLELHRAVLDLKARSTQFAVPGLDLLMAFTTTTLVQLEERTQSYNTTVYG